MAYASQYTAVGGVFCYFILCNDLVSPTLARPNAKTFLCELRFDLGNGISRFLRSRGKLIFPRGCMNDSTHIGCSMSYALFRIKNELEDSGFDRVVLEPLTNNFFCMGEGAPESFDSFRMVCRNEQQKMSLVYKTLTSLS